MHPVTTLVYLTGTVSVIKQMLTALPGFAFRAIQANDWEAAVEQLHQQGTDILLYETPVVDAAVETTIRDCCAAFPSVCLIVVAPGMEQAVVERAMNCGAQDYLDATTLCRNLLMKTIVFARQRNQLKVQLRNIAHDYRELFDTNPLPMWLYELETGKFIKVNNAAIFTYGYTAEEFYAKTILDIRPPEDKAAVRSLLGLPVQQVERHKGIWRHCKKNGDLIHVQVTAHVTLYKGRQTVLATLYDITGSIIAEEERKTALQQLVAVFENTTNAILLSDDKGNCIEANQSACTLLDYSYESLLALTAEDLVHPSAIRYLEGSWQQLVKQGFLHNRLKLISGKGHRKTVVCRAVANLRPGIHLFIMDDVTEKEMQQKEDVLKGAILSVLTEQASLNEILQGITAVIRHFTRWKAAEIWLPGIRDTDLYLHSCEVDDADPAFVCMQQRVLAREGKQVWKSLFNGTWASGQPIWRPNLQGSKMFLDERSLPADRSYTALTIPFFENPGKGVLQGILVCIDDQFHERDEQLLTILSRISCFIADAIVKTRVREELTRLFNCSADLICILDFDGYFVKGNPAFAQVTGYPEIDFNLHHYSQLVLEEDWGKTAATMQKLLNGESVYGFVNRLRTASGATSYLDWVAVPSMKDRQIFAIGRDITELKKKSEEALQHAQEITRTRNNQDAMINSSEDLIWAIDADMRLISANRAFYQVATALFGYNVKEGDLLLDASLSSGSTKDWEQHYRKALTGEAFSFIAHAPVSEASYKKASMISLNPILDPNGQISGVACLSRNITELNESLSKIKQQNQILKEIAWSQSHEVRAPVARLMALVELMHYEQPGNLSEPVLKLLNYIHQSAMELDQIIRAIVSKTNEVIQQTKIAEMVIETMEEEQ